MCSTNLNIKDKQYKIHMAPPERGNVPHPAEEVQNA
jgi:hypothetical protein